MRRDSPNIETSVDNIQDFGYEPALQIDLKKPKCDRCFFMIGSLLTFLVIWLLIIFTMNHLVWLIVFATILIVYLSVAFCLICVLKSEYLDA